MGLGRGGEGRGGERVVWRGLSAAVAGSQRMVDGIQIEAKASPKINPYRAGRTDPSPPAAPDKEATSVS